MKFSLFTFALSYLFAFSTAAAVAKRDSSDLINEFGTAMSTISSFSNVLLGGYNSNTNFTSGLEGILSTLTDLSSTVTSSDISALPFSDIITTITQFLSTLVSFVIHLGLFIVTAGADAIPEAAQLLSSIIATVATIIASFVDGNSAFEVLVSPFSEIAKLLEGVLNLC